MHLIAALFERTPREWAGFLIGGSVGITLGIVFRALTGSLDRGTRWWRERRPVHMVLQRAASPVEPVLVFVRDLEAPRAPDPAGAMKPVTLTTREPLTGAAGQVEDVPHLWSRVEATAYGNVLSVLSQAGKTSRVELVEMSRDTGHWDASLIVLGTEAQRCMQFYDQMAGVAYRIDPARGEIVDETGGGSTIPRIPGYGYGIILKARNPMRTRGGPAVAFLIGGYGVLGTEAAGYYFRSALGELAALFGDRTFGVVVRADPVAGAESVRRLDAYDRATEPKSRQRALWEKMMPLAARQVDATRPRPPPRAHEHLVRDDALHRR